RRVIRTAARRRERSGAAHAERDRIGRQGVRLHQESEVGRGRHAADGVRPPRLQVVRSAREGDQEDRRPRVRGHGQEPAARDRPRAGAHRIAGRLLRHPQALPQRRLLFGAHLPGDGLPGRDVSRAVRDSANGRLDRAVGRDAARLRTEDRAPATDLYWASTAHVYPPGETRMTKALLLAALALQAAAPPPKFDSGQAWKHLRQMVAIGPRPAGSAAIETTRKYIKDQLSAAGLTAVEQAWEDQTPLDKVKMVNLVATIPGARKERIVIAG